MAVTPDDVRHIAALARLGIAPERVPQLVSELNGILRHMHVLSKVHTADVDAAYGVGAGGMPLRADDGAPYPLARSRDAFAPALEDGFFVVPRLASHLDAGARASQEHDDEESDA